MLYEISKTRNTDQGSVIELCAYPHAVAASGSGTRSEEGFLGNFK